MIKIYSKNWSVTLTCVQSHFRLIKLFRIALYSLEIEVCVGDFVIIITYMCVSFVSFSFAAFYSFIYVCLAQVCWSLYVENSRSLSHSVWQWFNRKCRYTHFFFCVPTPYFLFFVDLPIYKFWVHCFIQCHNIGVKFFVYLERNFTSIATEYFNCWFSDWDFNWCSLEKLCEYRVVDVLSNDKRWRLIKNKRWRYRVWH